MPVNGRGGRTLKIVGMPGVGGMGRVYLAEHVRMGRRSAVKVMGRALVNDRDALSRFNREASNASRISHHHVAAIYDFGETPDGLVYLAMEFVEGEPLTNILRREPVLSPGRAAVVVSQVADGLDAAHALGIVHRDLKPDNLMYDPATRREDAGSTPAAGADAAAAAPKPASAPAPAYPVPPGDPKKEPQVTS